jgi:hypothetical protein
VAREGVTLREEPIKQNDHGMDGMDGMDALRYLAWSELGLAGTTDAYLAELERALHSLPARDGIIHS